MQTHKWPWRELALIAGFYLTFALFYAGVLRWSYPAMYDAPEGLFDYFNWRIVYLDYPLKALFTLPIWYVMFRVLRRWSVWTKVLLNLVLLPVWVKGWQWTYYWIVDTFFNGGHLRGPGEWWDVYIPALFYVLQFGIFHAYNYYRNLRSAERARAESERLALASELSALKAQLNPHFLYNAFNTISASTGPGQEHTRGMIARLSDLFRYQLRANLADRLPLADELTFIEDYLTLEQERFGERLRYRIGVSDEELRQALIAPLLLQPLVENAVRHGIAPLVEGGTVTVGVRAEGDRLHLSVADDGVGIDPDTIKRGYGLTNTERRLTLLYRSTLHLRPRPPQGTLCTFSIPLVYASPSPQSTGDRRRAPRPAPAAGIPG